MMSFEFTSLTRWLPLAAIAFLGVAPGMNAQLPAGHAKAAQVALASRHPAMEDVPGVTQTRKGFPGDPINVALVATERELADAMMTAGWHPADPITLKSCLRVTTSAVFHMPYADAPVSNLYVWQRKQDLAFEQPVGKGAGRRHHARFWMSEKVDADGRPLWVGAATYDSRIEISHITHLLTHHISPDVDSERDKVFRDLGAAGKVASSYWIDGFQTDREGRNGGGDLYYTDGRLAVGIIATMEVAGRDPKAGTGTEK